MRPFLLAGLLCLALAACTSTPGGEGATCADDLDCDAPFFCRNDVCGASSTSEQKDGGGDDGPVDPNNRAELSGAAFGGGTEAVATLAAPIAITVTSAPAGLRVGTATKARTDSSSGLYRLIVPVENEGTRAHCFVRTTFRVKNGADTLLDEEFTYVQGSVGNGAAGYTDTCLWPGEKGWSLVLSDGVAWDAIAKVEVTLSTSSAGPYSRPDPKVLPTSYRVQDGKLVVTAKNHGPGSIALGSARFIYLGADGAPLGWSLMALAPEALVEAGQSTDVAELTQWKGTATKIDVLFDFERR